MLATRAARIRRDAGKRGKRDVCVCVCLPSFPVHSSISPSLGRICRICRICSAIPRDNCVCLCLLILLGESMNHFLFTNGPGGIAGKQDVTSNGGPSLVDTSKMPLGDSSCVLHIRAYSDGSVPTSLLAIPSRKAAEQTGGKKTPRR